MKLTPQDIVKKYEQASFQSADSEKKIAALQDDIKSMYALLQRTCISLSVATGNLHEAQSAKESADLIKSKLVSYYGPAKSFVKSVNKIKTDLAKTEDKLLRRKVALSEWYNIPK